MNPERTARVKKHQVRIKATGEVVDVYRHRGGGFVNWNDMTTRYQSEDVVRL